MESKCGTKSIWERSINMAKFINVNSQSAGSTLDNGQIWIEVGSGTMPTALSWHTALVFDSKMWVIGGSVDGATGSQKVYYSTDGITWTEAGTNALPKALYSHSAIAYNNKMWVMGGRDNATGTYEAYVYFSTDGITWTASGFNALRYAAWEHASLVFNDKMWVIGGQTRYPPVGGSFTHNKVLISCPMTDTVVITGASNSTGTLLYLTKTHTGTSPAIVIINSGSGESILDDSGAKLTAAGVWTDASSEDLKENFEDLNNAEILTKVTILNVKKYNYIKDTPLGIKHCSPTAEEFYAAFGLGDSTSISPKDMAGIAYAAIKALKAENESLLSRIEALEIRVTNLGG